MVAALPLCCPAAVLPCLRPVTLFAACGSRATLEPRERERANVRFESRRHFGTHRAFSTALPLYRPAAAAWSHRCTA